MYGLNTYFKALDGKRDEFIEILYSAASKLKGAKGLYIYSISKSTKEADIVHVYEAWDTKENHDQSLQMEGVSELIQKALPLINPMEIKQEELEITSIQDINAG